MQATKQTSPISWPDIITVLSELVIFDQFTFQEFLERLIALILHIVPVDSCLIYFKDPETKKLTLVGSNQKHTAILNKLSLEVGEGITGWVAQHHKTVVLFEKAYDDNQFKVFQELQEDTYESFLSVPILNERGIVGVINLQNKKPYSFSAEEIMIIEAVTKIIATGFAKIMLQRKIETLSDRLEERKMLEKAKGILMKVRNLSEQEAFRFLRTESMNKRKSMKEIAEAILLIWE